MVVKAQYICSMQVDNNWYWNQQPKQHSITVPAGSIIHPQIEVNAVTYFHSISTSVCRNKQKYIYQDSLYI